MQIQFFHDHSYTTEIETTVTEVERRPDHSVVTAHPTIFYPGGGGQPPDTGTIDGVPIVEITDHVGEAVYVLNGHVGSGRRVMSIDWPRRFDHMQQHSGQHLLSHVTEGLLGVRTAAFDMGRGEITFDRDDPFSDTEIREIEDYVNRYIRDDLDIVVSVDAAGTRQVDIHGVGRQPCGGTHLSRTAELQLMILSRHSETRIVFLAGDRALRHLRNGLERDAHLTRVLSTSREHHVAAVEQAVLSKTRATKELKSARGLAARTLADIVGANPERVIWQLGDVGDQVLVEAAALLRGQHNGVRVLLLARRSRGGVRWAITGAGPAEFDRIVEAGEGCTDDVELRGAALLGTSHHDIKALTAHLVSLGLLRSEEPAR
ncbi:alanyl-tRNA editing protein [Nocardia beijingensis]|uniref:alanyl-tRNA editing protein n=1 Tax=Nocardia beijingensis TaxID=95162 RepID=UPI001893E3C4|nr:alanyl-tRNA editing protein [Nocardia beijingensis]MBF6074266.1 alanyl-tRNA editing protein [Nocardia beijingensis]